MMQLFRRRGPTCVKPMDIRNCGDVVEGLAVEKLKERWDSFELIEK